MNVFAGWGCVRARRCFRAISIPVSVAPWGECKKSGFRSLAVLSLLCGDDVIDVMGLAADTESDFETQSGLLKTIASLVSMALYNIHLYDQVRRELDEHKKDDIKKVCKVINNLQASENRYVVEPRLTRKNASIIWAEAMGRRFRDISGNVMKIQCNVRDITKRKRSEEEQQKLQAQLLPAQKMESIGTLAGGIAHNFNNILMGIQGRTSLMMTGS